MTFNGTIIDDTNYDEYVGNDDVGNDDVGNDDVYREDVCDGSDEVRCDAHARPDLAECLKRSAARNVRTKPSYTDCWVIGDRSRLDVIQQYDTMNGNVVIGYADDGQIEYNVIPKEYVFNADMMQMIDEVIVELRNMIINGKDTPSKNLIVSMTTGLLLKRIGLIGSICDDPASTDSMISDIAETVYRHTMGSGIFDVLLSDNRIEDIYMDAPCDENRIHVTMNGVDGFNSQIRCRTNLMVDRREVQNLISILKRDSGLPFNGSSPVLETDMREYDARITVIGHPISPKGDAVAIRKHSSMPWTLTRLIGNGTIDRHTAGLLSFLVDSRSTVLIGGPRGSGKSSLLAALLFEFPLAQRIVTIEDTLELPSETMKGLGFKIQSMHIGDGGRDIHGKAEEALRVSLRMGESSIIMGEVRGAEAKTLYHSMRTGKTGSSVMGTIHGDSAISVHDRVVHDLGISKESFAATDIVVIMGTRRSKGDDRNFRCVSELVSVSDDPERFTDITNIGYNDDVFSTPVFKRIMRTSSLSIDDIRDDIKIRSGIRGFLADMSIEHGTRFYGAEWVVHANRIASQGISEGKDADDVVNGFKEWFRGYNGLVR